MSGPITFGLPRINYPVNIPVSSIAATASPVLFGRYSAGAGAGEQIALSAPFDVSGGTLTIQAGAQYELLGRSAAGAGPMSSVTRTAMNIASLNLANTFTLANVFGTNVTVQGNLVLNQNVTTLATPGVAAMYISPADGSTRSGVFQEGFANSPSLYFRRAQNTAAAPSALVLNNNIFALLCAGYGTTAYGSNRIVMAVSAAEAWTDTAQGTYLAFTLTTPGALTQSANVLRVEVDGGLKMYGSAAANVVIDTNRGLKRRAFTFATLPAAATSQDVEFVITDGAAAPAWLAAAAGGGAVRTPVISNGAVWNNG